MGVGEQHHGALGRGEPGEDPVDPVADRVERLAGADRGGPDRPVRIGDAQIDRAHAVVLAVVPLDEIVDHHGVLAEPGQLARAPSPLQRARPHACALDHRQRRQRRAQ